MGYIYKIINNVNDKVYIGKTTTTLENRWWHHKSDYLQYDWHLYKAMRKYGIDNFYMQLVEECNDDIINEREKFWIKEYNSYKNGYNETEGGDGRVQISREEVRKRWEQGKSCHQIALELSTQSATISNILSYLGLYDKEEIKRRKSLDIAQAQSEEKIYQYSEDGEIVAIYDSVLEASRAINGKAAGIRSAIYSKGSYFGYFWMRGTDKPEVHKIIRPKVRPVYQYEKDGRYIAEFSNAAEAARSIGKTDGSRILQVCSGKRKTTGGFIWSYERKEHL